MPETYDTITPFAYRSDNSDNRSSWHVLDECEVARFRGQQFRR